MLAINSFTVRPDHSNPKEACRCDWADRLQAHHTRTQHRRADLQAPGNQAIWPMPGAAG
jgi:hypothetical protein